MTIYTKLFKTMDISIQLLFKLLRRRSPKRSLRLPRRNWAQGGLSSKKVTSLYFLGDLKMLFTSLLKVKDCAILQ